MTKTRSRIVLRQTAYHQGEGMPVAVESGEGLWLDSDEQPYVRQQMIGPEPVAVDTGWLGDAVGLLVIQNPSKHPVLVGDNLVPPGMYVTLWPANVTAVLLSCDHPVRVIVNAFPR